jgi:hypothetical protein
MATEEPTVEGVEHRRRDNGRWWDDSQSVD